MSGTNLVNSDPVPGTAPGRLLVTLRKSESKPGRVMIVDDEPINIKLIQKYLREAGYTDFVITSDARKTVEMVRAEQPDIIILDVLMPYVTGLEILEVIRSDDELAALPVLIITASTDEQTKIEALELGATDFLNKPVKPTELLPRVRNALVLKAHHDQMAAYSKRLEIEVAQRTMDLKQSREEVIHVLACAAEYRDHETGNHVIRVGRFAGIIARQLGLPSDRAELIEQAAILHDAGKIGIADSILLKPGKLTPEEFAIMKRHCEYGQRILSAQPNYDGQPFQQFSQRPKTRSPILATAAVIAMTHHERWDGTGYPRGLSGEEIPIEGRITAVADVFDALSSRRCYKNPQPLDDCLETMLQYSGTHFDPRVLEAFLSRIDEVARIVMRLSDAF
ncbi:response regulator [Roseiconus nitratireducens]|uniref:Response regulator n=1 Tax=Roseiconus nitratireducens TaxID=2605748 RepID=A0A5M6CUD0_9BACT|nr:HD domain-containing phosphohydrolase [Roseiconus nitratireducens]KAA5538546.1 response regulator [Roseiconus nitratireducens]